MAARDEPERKRLRTGDGAVEAGLGGRRRDVVLLERSAHLRRLAVSMPSVQCRDVGFGELGRLGELRLQPVDDRLPVAVEHPQRKTKRPHVLATQGLLVAEAEGLHGIERQLRDVEVDDLPSGEAAVLERVLLVPRLGEIAGRELALVDNEEAALAHLVSVHLKRRGVHRYEHVGLVACGLDGSGAEIDLESGDAERRALRRADLRREIGEGREIVSGERGRERELTARQLHSVAAIAGEAHDDGLGRRMRRGFLFSQLMGGGGHDKSFTNARVLSCYAL